VKQSRAGEHTTAPVGAPPAAVKIADPEAALFISDMHLQDSDPALAGRCFEMMQATLDRALARTRGSTIFLLGDLFEYWVGDDHVSPVAETMADLLADFATRGGTVCLMHGNRDFLMDVPLPGQPDVPAFSARCGGTLLPDPTTIEVAGRRIGLSHGDALCVADVQYQQWRALCRSAGWQQQFLSLPLAERLSMAQELRRQSVENHATTETTHDVDPEAVDALMTRLDTSLLIHGHTHLPHLHRWRVSDAPGAGARMRWVLSDWSASPPRGSVCSLAAAIPPAC
jgi:UDP-2,3-diacylglucosamine hydrolase